MPASQTQNPFLQERNQTVTLYTVHLGVQCPLRACKDLTLSRQGDQVLDLGGKRHEQDAQDVTCVCQNAPS